MKRYSEGLRLRAAGTTAPLRDGLNLCEAMQFPVRQYLLAGLRELILICCNRKNSQHLNSMWLASLEDISGLNYEFNQRFGR